MGEKMKKNNLMEKREKLYEGKAKIIYSTDDPKYVIQYFKDDATAFNGQKKDTIKNKGIVNNYVSSKIFEYLENSAVKTHFVKKLNDREMLCLRVDIIPIEVVMRNYTAGSICKRLGLEEGIRLYTPIIEYFYKNDELNDPLINEYHIKLLRLATEGDLMEIRSKSYMVNCLVEMFFERYGIKLVDFKLEYGRVEDQIILADEISGDTCRLWDMKTNKKLDKDVFRFDLGSTEDAYSEIYNRLI